MKTVMMLSFIMALSGCTLNSDCKRDTEDAYWHGREDGKIRLLNELKEEKNNIVVYGAKVRIVGGFYKGQAGVIVEEQNEDWVFVQFVYQGSSHRELVTKLNIEVIK